jgi:hypothetical protein
LSDVKGCGLLGAIPEVTEVEPRWRTLGWPDEAMLAKLRGVAAR